MATADAEVAGSLEPTAVADAKAFVEAEKAEDDEGATNPTPFATKVMPPVGGPLLWDRPPGPP